MALADFLNKNTGLDKFNFDPKTVTEQQKIKNIPVGTELPVRAMFFGKDKQGKAYATVYTNTFYFFVPAALVGKVTQMCKDSEVRQAINEGKLVANIYEYENTFGKFNSVSFSVQ